MQLTRDADKLACSMYKSYLERRKTGIDKNNARHFSFPEIESLKCCDSWIDADIKATTAELARSNLGTMYLDGGFFANDNFIIYMENRFINGLKDVTDFLTKFIP